MEKTMIRTAIQTRSEEAITVKVPVSYEVCGTVEMTFASVEDMVKQLKDFNVVDDMPLADDADYVDGSYEVNFDVLACDWDIQELL